MIMFISRAGSTGLSTFPRRTPHRGPHRTFCRAPCRVLAMPLAAPFAPLAVPRPHPAAPSVARPKREKVCVYSNKY
jgi:hypothetical protein